MSKPRFFRTSLTAALVAGLVAACGDGDTTTAELMVAQPAAVSAAPFDKTQYAVHLTNFVGKLPAADKPESGFDNINFSIIVMDGPAQKNLFYSQTAYFATNSDQNPRMFYTGLQPNSGGVALVLFSVFGADARPVDLEHCKQGADNRPGATCNKVYIPFRQGVTYNFHAFVARTSDSENFWEGYVIDTSTDTVTRIGSWATPVSWQNLTGHSIGFIEDYIGIERCSDVPATTAHFGAATSTLSDARISHGSIAAPYAVGVCSGKVAFKSRADAIGGQTITQQGGSD